MIRRYSYFCLVLIALLTLVAPQRTSATPSLQTDGIPYVMAYSNDLAPHFVIERADGADSRSFGEDLMPDDTNTVSGPGWSPSGQWFAWTANSQYSGGVGDRGASAYILSADEQIRPTGLDNMSRLNMAWSPTADILVVAGLLNPVEAATDEPLSLTARIGLFDPARDEFLQFHDVPAPFEYLLDVGYDVRWLKDGTYAMADPGGENTSPTIEMYYLGIDGDFGSRSYDAKTLMVFSDYYPLIRLSPSGAVVYELEDGSALLEDVVTGQSVPLRFGDEQIQRVYWSADGERALIKTSLPCEEPNCPNMGLWLFTRADNQLITIVPLQTDPFNIYPAPDFSRLVYVETRADAENAIYLDLTTFNHVELGTITPDEYDAYSLMEWTGSSRFVMLRNYDDEGLPRFAAYTVEGDAPVLNGEFTVATYSTPTVAPGSSTILSAFNTVSLLDITQNTSVILPPDPRRYFAEGPSNSRWHPDSDWALLEESALRAGGGIPTYNGVVNADGSVRRSVGYCFVPTIRCLDWLPPQVDPSTLAPGSDNTLPNPISTIETGYWMGELIWSTDMSQIAVGSEWRDFYDPVSFTVVNVADGEIAASFESVTGDETIGWVEGQPEITTRDLTSAMVAEGYLAVGPDLTARKSVDGDTYDVYLELLDASGAVQLRLEHLIEDWHANADFSLDGRYLVMSSADSSVRIIDTQTGEIVGELPLLYSNAVAFSPDGTQLAVAYATQIWIYAVEGIIKG